MWALGDGDGGGYSCSLLGSDVENAMVCGFHFRYRQSDHYTGDGITISPRFRTHRVLALLEFALSSVIAIRSSISHHSKKPPLSVLHEGEHWHVWH